MDDSTLTLYGFPNLTHFNDPTSPNRIEWFAITEESAEEKRNSPEYKKCPEFNFFEHTKTIRVLTVMSHLELPNLDNLYVVIGADTRGSFSLYSFTSWRNLQLPLPPKKKQHFLRSLINTSFPKGKIPLSVLVEMDDHECWSGMSYCFGQDQDSYIAYYQLVISSEDSPIFTAHVIEEFDAGEARLNLFFGEREASRFQAEVLYRKGYVCCYPGVCCYCGSVYPEPRHVAISPYCCDHCQ